MPPTPTFGASISRHIAVILVSLFAILTATFAAADDFILEVLPLQHRGAAELLPQVRDFVAKDGTIEAADDKLIIRTHPANMNELRELIAKLDKPLRRLVITVKQLSGESARLAETSTDDAEMNGSGAHVWRTERRDDADRIQQAQVVENKAVFIDVGREVPISDFAVSQSRAGTLMEQKTRYVGVTTGFYARPHLVGDTLSVEITPYQTTQRGAATPPEFRTQALHTTVSGKLGDWITVGASSSRETKSGMMEYSTSQRDEQDRRILLRVTVAQ